MDSDDRITLTDRELRRFWRKVNRHGPTPTHRPELGPCHVWTGRIGAHGYAVIHIQGKGHYVHRVAFLIADGRWPEPCALHHCDNRSCVRREHLFQGTLADNTADMRAKGRARPTPSFGENHGGAKLTAADVLALRAAVAAGATRRAMRERFGISASQVDNIVNGRHWRHL